MEEKVCCSKCRTLQAENKRADSKRCPPSEKTLNFCRMIVCHCSLFVRIVVAGPTTQVVFTVIRNCVHSDYVYVVLNSLRVECDKSACASRKMISCAKFLRCRHPHTKTTQKCMVLLGSKCSLNRFVREDRLSSYKKTGNFVLCDEIL